MGASVAAASGHEEENVRAYAVVQTGYFFNNGMPQRRVLRCGPSGSIPDGYLLDTWAVDYDQALTFLMALNDADRPAPPPAKPRGQTLRENNARRRAEAERIKLARWNSAAKLLREINESSAKKC